MTTAGRGDRRFKELAKRLRRERPAVCHLCTDRIDLTLPATHRMSWTLDHISPLDEGKFDPWDESNLAPAHRSCNSRKGNSNLPQIGQAVFSRKWI